MSKKSTKHAPGSWRGPRFYVRMRAQKGHKRQISVPFDTQREADAWYFDVARPAYLAGREVRRPENQPEKSAPLPKRVRFAEGVELWWRFYVRERGRDVSVETHKSHRRHLERHLLPRFGSMWADEVTEEDMAQLRDDLCDQDYSAGSTRAILITASMIFGYLQQRGLVQGVPSSQIVPRTPSTTLHRTPKFTDLVTLEETEQIADLMPRHLRAAVWVQRLAGLRVAEVFGLRVENVLKSQGFLQVRSQGGKRYTVRGADGTVSVTAFRDELKTEAGRRDVPLCNALLDALADHIEDYCDGGADPSMRLFNKGAERNRCMTYNAALGRASMQLGVVDDKGMQLTSHTLRKSFSTDLDHGNILGILWSRTLGHKVKSFDGGAEVTADRYTLTPTQDRLHEVSRLMDSLVREANAEVSLDAPSDLDESVYTTYGIAASMLGVEGPESVGRLVGEGHLEATRPLRGENGRHRRFVVIESILRMRMAIAEEVTTEAIREQFQLSTMQLHAIKDRCGIKTVMSRFGTGAHVWTSEQVDLVAAEVEKVRELRSEAMTLSEAAGALGFATTETVKSLIKAGVLTELPQLAGVLRGRPRWVTCESVEEYKRRYGVGPTLSHLSSKRHPATAPKGCLTYAQAAERLGLGKKANVAQMVSQGKLTKQNVPGRGNHGFVTEASVNALITERAKRGLVSADATPAGYLTLSRAAARMGVTKPALRTNLKAWGLHVEPIRVNGVEVQALTVEAVEKIGVPAAAQWKSRPKYGNDKYRPSPDYLSVPEIAELTGVAIGTARARISNGHYTDAVCIEGQGRRWWFVPQSSVTNTENAAA